MNKKCLVRLCRLTLPAAVLFLMIMESPAQEVWRPFADASIWNMPIGENPLIDPDSDRYLAQINADYRQQTQARDQCFVSTSRESWGVAFYFIDQLSPYPATLIVNAHTNWGQPLSAPFPSGAVADPSEDAHLCIVDRNANLEWDFWNVKGRYPALSCGSSALVNTLGDGIVVGSHGCREAGFPLSAGLIRPEELVAGKISHALVYGFDCRNGYDQFVYPAITGCDDKNGPNGSQVLPIGARLQLKPQTDISRLTPSARIIAQALKTYGMFLGDEGDSHSFSIFIQSAGHINNTGQLLHYHDLWKNIWTEADRVTLLQLRAGDFRVVQLPTIGGGRPPLIEFSSPAVTITTDKNINFEINVRAGAAPIKQVVFYLDDASYRQAHFTDTAAPFIWRVAAGRLSPGRHTVYAVAIDQKGATGWTQKACFMAR